MWIGILFNGFRLVDQIDLSCVVTCYYNIINCAQNRRGGADVQKGRSRGGCVSQLMRPSLALSPPPSLHFCRGRKRIASFRTFIYAEAHPDARSDRRIIWDSEYLWSNGVSSAASRRDFAVKGSIRWRLLSLTEAREVMLMEGCGCGGPGGCSHPFAWAVTRIM